MQMNYRSWLIVPGNSEKKLGRAVGAGADAIIVDLASVPHELKHHARLLAGEWLAATRQNVLENRLGRWVRINAMDQSGTWREDLLTVMAAAPDGIMLPKAAGPEEVRQLAAEIYEAEERQHLPSNSTQIIPVVGETALSAMTIGQYIGQAHQRICALAWDADALASAISATEVMGRDGQLAGVFASVRAQTLLTAHACGVMAIESALGDVTDTQILVARARSARAEGFSGMVATHADQVRFINEAFACNERDIVEAREILSAFEANPGAGSIEFKGRLLHQSQRLMAERTLGRTSGHAHRTPAPSSQATAVLRPA